jgi:hypothetical protein
MEQINDPDDYRFEGSINKQSSMDIVKVRINGNRSTDRKLCPG